MLKHTSQKIPVFSVEAGEHNELGIKTNPNRDFQSCLIDLKNQAERIFEAARKSHDWDHTLRVHRLCQRIGLAENADMAVLEAAAYLHDIGRSDQDRSRGQICHAERGSQIASGIVQRLSLSPTQKDNIIHCVRTHRFRGNMKPVTIEAQVLFDADKLDAIGAVGVARAYLFAGELGAILHNPHNDIRQARAYSVEDTGYREYKVKLCHVKDRMLTATGRQLAIDRHQFMVLFFDRFIEEYAGER